MAGFPFSQAVRQETAAQVLKITEAAFRFNVENLEDQSENKRLYLWTFTRRKAEEPVAVRACWNRFLTVMKKRQPKWMGLRVYEMHPGGPDGLSHGLHVHVLTNSFFHVNVVRNLAQKYGFGRVHVKRCNAGAGAYLAKYLSKSRPACLKGWRLWACFGPQFAIRTRCGDVQKKSLRTRCWAFLKIAHIGWDKLPFHERERLAESLYRQLIFDDGFFWTDENDRLRLYLPSKGAPF